MGTKCNPEKYYELYEYPSTPSPSFFNGTINEGKRALKKENWNAYGSGGYSIKSDNSQGEESGYGGEQAGREWAWRSAWRGTEGGTNEGRGGEGYSGAGRQSQRQKMRAENGVWD